MTDKDMTVEEREELYRMVSAFHGFVARYVLRLMLQGVSLKSAIELGYYDFGCGGKGKSP